MAFATALVAFTSECARRGELIEAGGQAVNVAALLGEALNVALAGRRRSHR